MLGTGSPLVLLTRVLLSSLRLELKAGEPFVADDLGVVARLDHVQVDRGKVACAS